MASGHRQSASSRGVWSVLRSGALTRPISGHVRQVAAVAAFGVGAIHALELFDQFEVWAPYGMAFIVIVTVQVSLGVALLAQPWRYDAIGWMAADADRRARPYYRAGVAVNLVLIAAYLLRWSVGVPLVAANAGAAQRLSLEGAASMLGELVVAACLALLLRRQRAVSWA